MSFHAGSLGTLGNGERVNVTMRFDDSPPFSFTSSSMLMGEVLLTDLRLFDRITTTMRDSHWLALQTGEDQALIDVSDALPPVHKFLEICKTIAP